MPDERGYTSKNAATFSIAVFALGLAVVVLAGLVSFPRIASGLFFSWDSAAFVTNAKEYLEDGTITRLIANYTQSFGNLAYPINFNLLPEVRLAYINGQINPVLMYVLASAFFFMATFGIVVITGFRPLTALVSGLVMVMLTMPFTSPPAYTQSFWWDTPIWIPMIYTFAALFVTFRLIGRFHTIGNLLAILLLCGEVLWVIVGFAKGGFVLLLGVTWYCMAMLAASDSPRELAWKALGGLTVASVLLLTGPLEFVRGLYAYTGNMLFLPSLEALAFDPLAQLNDLFFFKRGLSWLTHAWVWVRYYLGIPLTVLAMLGAVWTMLSPPTKMARYIAVATLTISPFLLYFIYGGVIAGEMYPVLVMFAVVAILRTVHFVCFMVMQHLRARAFGVLIRRTGQKFPKVLVNRWVAAGIIAIVAMGLTLFSARYMQAAPTGWRYPPLRHPLIDLLATDIRFRPGDPFRGRYLDMSITAPLESGILPADDWLAAGLMKTSYDHVMAYGNDLTINGPRFYDIPIAIEANRMNTPVSVLFHHFLLMEEGQKERVDFRQITHFDSRWFRLLGIRYVLSHRPLEKTSASRVEVSQLPAGTALYEVGGVNVGQYSPTKIILVPEWRAALENLAAADFDPQRMALTHDDWVGQLPLTPAKGVIERTRDGYRVTATSSGRSLLVLPFEFTRCLTMSAQEHTVRIGRVDFFLTGIVFEKNVDAVLRFRFGPFENAGCRLADLADVRRMGLNIASFAEFRKKYPNRFLIGGVF